MYIGIPRAAFGFFLPLLFVTTIKALSVKKIMDSQVLGERWRALSVRLNDIFKCDCPRINTIVVQSTAKVWSERNMKLTSRDGILTYYNRIGFSPIWISLTLPLYIHPLFEVCLQCAITVSVRIYIRLLLTLKIHVILMVIFFPPS